MAVAAESTRTAASLGTAAPAPQYARDVTGVPDLGASEVPGNTYLMASNLNLPLQKNTLGSRQYTSLLASKTWLSRSQSSLDITLVPRHRTYLDITLILRSRLSLEHHT